MKFKLGDIAKSTWNTYGDYPCLVDRIYQRKDGSDMLRLRFTYKGEEKKINVPEKTCKIDISHIRNEKLNELGI
jgi:hypothetical protein